jgi:hypothetical protein
MTPREWWRSLQAPPPPLTRGERLALFAASILAALSRLLAVAGSPWDWDEFLFMVSLDHYNVAAHHPHPPGFPLYVATARLIHLFGVDAFHSLQLLSVAAGMLIVPAAFWLARELRLPPRSSLIAALLLAFWPNVWFYGGAAFSDVPSMVLVLAAAALLFRGCRDPRALIAGAAILGVAAGYRPQNLLIGFAPLAIAAVQQLRRRISAVVVAAVLLAAIVAGSYGAAAWFTGWQPYRRALAEHQAYIVTTDSYQAPGRPTLPRRVDDFFVRPFHAPAVNALITVFALVSGCVSLVRRRVPILAALAAFGPFCLFAWMMLDRFSASRFSIGYAPLVALLAADGIALVARRAVIEGALAAMVLAVMIAWTLPALSAVRGSTAPTVAAVDWVRRHVDSRTAVIYVDEGMIPMAEWALGGYRLRYVHEDAPPAAWAMRHAGVYLREGGSNAPGAIIFSRPRGRLWNLARRRYFEVSITPAIIRYGSGWYEPEGEGGTLWRWMSRRSVTTLPPVQGRARLVLGIYVPLDVLGAPPEVTVSVNGKVVDRFVAARQNMQRQIDVDARGDDTNDLVIETSRTVNPAERGLGADARDLGLRINALGWMPVRG